MPLSLSELLTRYPFEKCDETSSLGGMHGVFVVICCEPRGGGVDCHLLDFGGSIDLQFAVEATLADYRWRELCPYPVEVMAAVVSPMSCETLLKELQQLEKMHL